VGENIYWLYIRQRTLNQNIWELIKLKSLQIDEAKEKCTTELNISFSKEEIQMAKKKKKT
jgi:hypothetical protein